MANPAAFAHQTCVVTGANRGIGLALTQALLQQGAAVWAGVRAPDAAKELHALQQQHPGRLHLLALDVASDGAVAAFSDALPTGPVDLLINNAGVHLDGGSAATDVSAEVMLASFNSNAVGPLRLTQRLLARLQQSPHPKVANISSAMGSIGENAQGGAVAYRTSKTALNMVTKCLALAEPNVVFLAMHPGWVQTRMGGEKAPVAVADSAAGLLRQMAGATKAQSGTFVRFDGQPAAW